MWLRGWFGNRPTVACEISRNVSAMKLGVHNFSSTLSPLLLGLLLVLAPFLADVSCCCARQISTAELAASEASCCSLKTPIGHDTARSCCKNREDASAPQHGRNTCCQLQAATCECAVVSESLPVSQLRRHSFGQQGFMPVLRVSADDAINISRLENAGRSADVGLMASSPSNRRQARLSVWRN